MSSGRLTPSSCSSRAGSKARGGAGSSGVLRVPSNRAISRTTGPWLRGSVVTLSAGSDDAGCQSVPIARASAKLSRSSTVEVFSQDEPPGQPFTLGGANSD